MVADVMLTQRRLMVVASSVVVITMVGMLFLGRWKKPGSEEAQATEAGQEQVQALVDENIVNDDFQAEPGDSEKPMPAGAESYVEAKPETQAPVLSDEKIDSVKDPQPLKPADNQGQTDEKGSAQPVENSATDQTPVWTLQVGAFSSEDSARSIAKILERNGHESWYRPKENLYKVFVGRYANRDAAVANRDALELSLKSLKQVPGNRPFPVLE